MVLLIPWFAFSIEGLAGLTDETHEKVKWYVALERQENFFTWPCVWQCDENLINLIPVVAFMI